MGIKEKFTFHGFIKFGLLPICMLIVVIVHFYHTKQGLSSWKGGAFGMYTTYYPEESQLYINGVDYSLKVKKNNKQFINLRNYLYYSNTDNLDVFIKSLNHPIDTLHIQVWQPKFDSKTATYSRTLKHEYNYVQSRR